MSRRYFGHLAIGLAVLVATMSPLNVISVWAAGPLWTAPRHSTSAVSSTLRPDVFSPTAANTTPIGNPGGPDLDKSGGGASELTSLRTRTSETFVSRAGYQLIGYPGSINYKDSSGKWKNIDNTIVKSHVPGYAYQNKANSYSVYFPSDLSQGPVEFTLGKASVAFSLLGAKGSVLTSENNAMYAGGLPNGSVAYTALNDQLKETLTLVNPSQSSFAYSLRINASMTAKLDAIGAVEFSDPAGNALFSFAPPYMVDAAGARSSAIQVQLLGAGSNRTLIMTADTTWLHDKTRQFPVVVDPTVTISYSGSSIVKTYTGANQDCHLASSSPTTSLCGATSLYVGHAGSTTDRSLLQFNVSIPQDANILEADLAAEVSHAASSTATSVSLYPVTAAWTTAASWNKREGTNSWTSAGGDFSSTPAWTNTSVGPTTGWYHWYLSSVVQAWVNGSSVNNGLILKADNEAATNQLTISSSEATHSSDWPYLKVIYQLGIGDLAWYQNASQELTDHLQLKENLSSGNLLAVQQLVNIKGTGLSELFNLNYNILSPNVWDFGRAWIANTAWDLYIDPNMGDGASFFGPTGYAFHYIKKPDATYATPPGIDADLTHNGDGTWTVMYHTSGEKLNFTSNGLYLTSDVDRNGNTIGFAYDGNGALASITDTQGRVTTFSYVNGSYTGCAPPTASGFVKKITDPVGRTYQFTYDANCDLATYIDPNTKLTTFGYDSLFNLIKITDALGNQTKLTYNNIYKVTSVTRVTNVAQGTGPTTLFTYNIGNTVVTDPNNNPSTHVYDSRDRVTQATDASGSTYTSFTTDNKHATDQDQLGNQASYTYNSSNDPTQATAPLLASGQTAPSSSATFNTPSTVAGYQYLPSSMTDAQSNCRAFVYDSSGRLTDLYTGQSAGCDGRTSGIHISNRYQGDPGIACGGKTGQLCSAISGNGGAMSYAYDANGNLTNVTSTSPLGGTTITYDSLSRISSVTDGKGQKTTYSFDALDRLTQALYNGATQCVPSNGSCITYGYDANGNSTSMVDQSGTTTYYFDALNRLTTVALPGGSYACPGSSPSGMTFGYDALGDVVSSCDSGGSTTYSYDADNQLVSIAEPGGSCGSSKSWCTMFGYNADGNRTSITFPGGASETTGFNNDQNVSSIIGKSSTGATLTSFAYTYVNGANDTTLVQTATENDPVAANTYTYSYNSQNELTHAAVTAGTGTSYTYAYDSDGNVLSKTAGSGTTTYAYNTADELCWAYSGTSSNACASAPSGATTYTYDANGNESGSSAGAAFSYNAKNQTTSTTLAGVTLSPLAYTDSGQQQRITTGTTSFANELGGVGVSTSGSASAYFLLDPSGRVMGERIGTNHYYFLTDRLGSVVAVITADGQTIANRYGYDPYGSTTYRSGTVSNPWGYSSGYTDATGLVHFGARYYDPSTARWTQPDPAQLGAHSYVYVGGDPINEVDPTGMYWERAYWWGILYDLSAWETGLLVRILVYAGAFLGIVGAVAAIVGYLASATGVGFVVGLLGLLVAFVGATVLYDAAAFDLVNYWGHDRGIWISIPWWVIWDRRGWAATGCNGCSWGLPIYVP